MIQPEINTQKRKKSDPDTIRCVRLVSQHHIRFRKTTKSNENFLLVIGLPCLIHDDDNDGDDH
ncbi:hypothetical protein DERP_008187 [Dermatophagoides pteronyssinus]|uniref:Uncharacterized protein n=1 Tax=Dermatophagoides pteronyssinus TaxID=6956 RepID=A0ABQ8JKS4_DERPT|nr:hypothetical protein DERP_008187 [Dermatophagoides pteronyssinus]